MSSWKAELSPRIQTMMLASFPALQRLVRNDIFHLTSLSQKVCPSVKSWAMCKLSHCIGDLALKAAGCKLSLKV